MKKELNTNDSKKLIIGVSILFCTVIFIIGATTAFFTQSDSETTGNIVSENINGTLVYNDNYEENNLYNRKALIPADLDVMLKTYRRTEEGKKCLDNNNHDSCSIYRFSIKNNSNVSQELIMNLNPTANSYTNLKFILFEIKNNNPEQISKEPILLEKGNYTAIQLVDNFTLTPSEERMYELVFYIENKPNEDQTSLDAGKEFGAHISVDSITTGAYVSKQYGATCWNVDPNEPSKLIAFNGINHDASITDFKESIVESCSGYVEADEEGFTVTIPSTFNNVEIKSLGNNLLNAIARDENGIPIELNKYANIKKITIQEGIERIEDGVYESYEGTFFGIGGDLINQKADPSKTLEVKLPNSLKYIGVTSFMASALREINIPVNVEYIGVVAFHAASNLTKVNFETVLDEDENKVSALRTIDLGAFWRCNLTYSHDNPLFIPVSVMDIEENAFSENPLLEALYYEGSDRSGWYDSGVTKLYP